MKKDLDKKEKFITDTFNDIKYYNKSSVLVEDIKAMISAIISVKEAGMYDLSNFIDNLPHDDYIDIINKSDMYADDKRKFILQHHLYQYMLELFIDNSITGKSIKSDLMGD